VTDCIQAAVAGEVSLPVNQVELCEALRSSVAALQREKEALCGEQGRHQALGASIETLVQERLKANERDKYSMFIGTTSQKNTHHPTVALLQCATGSGNQVVVAVCR